MADPQPDPRYVAAVLAYQQAVQALRDRLAGYVGRLWRSLGSYRDRDIARFVAQLVPIVAGAQLRIVALTAANLAAQRQAAFGGAFAPFPLDASRLIGAAVRNGTDPADVYARPFHLVWRQLDELPREAGSIEKAIAAGLDRAESLALDDLQLTKRQAALQILRTDDHVVGYRRVLEGPHSCGLCLVASTQRYHKDHLMPIHPACDCSVAPIWGTADPGRQIAAMAHVNGQLVPIAELPDVHDRIAQRFGQSSSAAREIPCTTDGHGRILKYRDALIVHEHGELGPVLAVRGRPFTGPDDIAA